MRVLIADDDRNVRSALRLLLEKELELEIDCEVENGRELLKEVDEVQPDLVLLDWELPGSKQEGLILEIKRCCPDTILVSLSGRPEARQQALQAGIDAFVSKGDPPEKVISALRKLLAQQAGD
jgi:DNA-binding NarL/FixJ family response regulator